ncbi:MAG: hypothetical protein RIQ47_1332 [Bacteroidota bacterium]
MLFYCLFSDNCTTFLTASNCILANMKKYIYPLTCIVIALWTTISSATAQVRFDRVDSVAAFIAGQQLSNSWTGGINFPMFNSIDLDGNGVDDMVCYDRVNARLTCYVNDGSPSLAAWHYAPQMAARFPALNRWLLVYDYNCDGKKDLFTLSPLNPACIACYRNDFSIANGLRFTLVDPILEESFSTTTFPIFASGVLIPAVDDIDGDGDMDILGYNSIPDGRVIFHKNESMETYGTCDSLKFSFANSCWGNFAFQVGGANEVGCFNCPCRTSSAPFASTTLEPVAEPTRRDDTVTSIFALDLDGDLDKDLLVGDISALTTLMVRNGGSPTVALMDSQDVNFPGYDTPAVFNGFHYHAYVDVDNDGLKDLIVSPNEYENKAAQWVYKNIGTAAVPNFHRISTSFLQDEMIDVGENAAPVVTDYDGDGKSDIVIAGAVYDTATSGYKTSLTLFRNIGWANEPAFDLVNGDIANISTLGYSSTIYPAFGDLDNDGDKDLLLGTEDGKLQHFANTATAGNSPNYILSAANYMGIDVGNNCTPQLIDLDRDGKLDLVCGEKNGFLNFYKNIGTASAAFFANIPSQDTLGGIVLQVPGYADGYAVPFFYDSAGVYRLAASNMDGNVYFYGNINGNILGNFTLLDSLYQNAESSRIRFNVSVGGGDLNNDGFVDLVIGESSGGVSLWYQHYGISSVATPDLDDFSVVLYPNPATQDFIVAMDNKFVAENTLIDLLDVQGRIISTQRVSTIKTRLNSSALSEGVYFVRVSSSKKTVTKVIYVIH